MRLSERRHAPTEAAPLREGDRRPLVWIVILNWNRANDTVSCVSSLRQSDYPRYRILVVDNGSSDDSVDTLQGLQGVDLLINEENLGFAAGSNRGIRYALEHGADYVLIMNNDTTVAPTMLSSLVQVAEADPELGILGPLIYYADEPNKVWFGGMRFRHGLYLVRKGLRLSAPLASVEKVDFVSGCAMLVRREVFETVGLFDPRFFMYYEDLDFCVRASNAGYEIGCATRASMWHALSASTGGPDSPEKQYYQVKSCFLFCEKHTTGVQRLANIGFRLAHAGFVTLRQVFQGRLQPRAVMLYVTGVVEVQNEVGTHEVP